LADPVTYLFSIYDFQEKRSSAELIFFRFLQVTMFLRFVFL